MPCSAFHTTCILYVVYKQATSETVSLGMYLLVAIGFTSMNDRKKLNRAQVTKLYCKSLYGFKIEGNMSLYGFQIELKISLTDALGFPAIIKLNLP